ncbi:twin-arginine translocase TatA/TatE family subunit [Aliikangiella maris]|uniref:Sec-independent protein translocase protein TatA n=2 Tax=Aliikangiella maris TaxID=3162458 RepID=A0ABV2BWN6_9GAMM
MLSFGQLVVILIIVILLFGTKRLKNMGADLGSAFKGFKKAVNDGENDKNADAEKAGSIEQQERSTIIEGEIVKDDTNKERAVKDKENTK